MARGPAARRSALARTAIALAALYALALQSVLGGLLPPPAVGVGAPGVLCAEHAPDGSPDKAAPHGHGDCCTAAHAAGVALPARADASSPAWPVARAVPLAWSPAETPRARAPPIRSHPPRGPPAA